MNVAVRDLPTLTGSALAGPVLSVSGLAKAFDGVKVLHGLDFTVHAGVATALIGAHRREWLGQVYGHEMPDPAGGTQFWKN